MRSELAIVTSKSMLRMKGPSSIPASAPRGRCKVGETHHTCVNPYIMVNMVDEESGIYCGLGGPAKCLPLFPAGAAAAANKHQQM